MPAILASAFEDIGLGYLVNLDRVSAEDPRVGAEGCYIPVEAVTKEIDLREAVAAAANWWLEDEGGCSALMVDGPADI